MGNGVLSLGEKRPGREVGHLVMRLRMSGVIPILPLHAFMAWTGKNFTFFSGLRNADAVYRNVRNKFLYFIKLVSNFPRFKEMCCRITLWLEQSKILLSHVHNMLLISSMYKR